MHLQLEEDREAALRDEEHVPNLSLCNETENDFIREYLAAQQARFQVQREAKKQYEEKKRESEASAEETTQDEDEASDVSPSKKSPRKAMRPKKKEDSTSTPKGHKSLLDFQTPDSMPYSTPPHEKRDDDGARHESDTTGEEEECMTPQTRKHKLLKYVQQPSASKGSHPGKSDTGQFSIVDHVEKCQGSGTSERRDPPPSSLYGEAINLKVESKETSPVKKESSPVKKEASPVKKEASPVKVETPPSAKKDERVLRGQKARNVKAPPANVSDEEEEEEDEEKGVFPRLVEVWSEKEREEEAAASAGKSLVQKFEKPKEDVEHPSVNAKEDGPKSHVIDVNPIEECKSESPLDPVPCQNDPLEDTTTVTTAQPIPVKDEAKPGTDESAVEALPAEAAATEKDQPEKSEEKAVDTKASDTVDMAKDEEVDKSSKTSDHVVVENEKGETNMEETVVIPTTVDVPENISNVEMASPVNVVESATVLDTVESAPVPDAVDSTPVPDAANSAPVPDAVDSALVLDAVDSAPVPDAVDSTLAPETVESVPDHVESVPEVVEIVSVSAATETADKTTLPAPTEPSVDLVSVEKASVPSESVVENIANIESEPDAKITPVSDLEPEKKDEPEREDEEVNEPPDSQKINIDLSPDKVETTMAVENESPSLIKSDVCEQPAAKADTVSEEQTPEDNEEDELQMDTTEIIDDSLKLTAPETEDVPDNSEQIHRKSSSRSPSPRKSSSEVEKDRNGKSTPPHEKLQASDATPQNESSKGDSVRKWKIRKQLPSAEGDTGEPEAPRKRRWGTSQLLPTKKPALVISTDSLKTLVPDAKPLSAEEVRLGSPNFQPSVKPTVNQTQESEEHHSSTADKVEKAENVRRVAVEMAAEAFAPAKPEVVMAAAAPLLEATSPAQQPRSSVLNVSNLVRPFTINQLKELLARTGHLVDGKFWIDRVKSSCLVQYATEEEAEETRAALHGIHWPTSNPKTLLVDYSTVEDLENRMSGKETTNPPVAKIEPMLRTAAPTVQSIEGKRDKAEKVREWDLGKTGDQGLEKEQSAKGARLTCEDEEVKPKDETPAKLLDDLFRKTKATPFIYWLPLTASQIAEKEEMRRQRLAERETRLREVQQRRDEELQQRQREREKQRETERERQRARERERDKDRQRSRKRSRSSSRSSSSTTSSSPNKRRNSKTPPRKR
uniref:EOG090X0F73 n=1 Tax=Daphnia dolichocephala TaxID=2282166 RepID=A0A4Y7M4F0_9CRUS|nr:EOG090X0F73 [Daphnia dolichocephala]